jgi:hypothetical protein
MREKMVYQPNNDDAYDTIEAGEKITSTILSIIGDMPLSLGMACVSFGIYYLLVMIQEGCDQDAIETFKNSLDKLKKANNGK